MKTFLVVALLVAVATIEPATSDILRSDQSQQSFPQQPQKQTIQSFFEQQLISCRDVMLLQCNILVPSFKSQILQENVCAVMRKECCEQFRQVPEQSRCLAINSVAHAIILHEQQQHQQQQQQYSWGVGTFKLPQQQYPSVQGSIQPPFEAIRAFVLQTLPAACGAYVSQYCSTTTGSFGGFVGN
ncbi:alpha/beta-gliadin MM1-like [Aegilops tauschii subsp. strangulata]|uniref:Prolamin n=1 Tax=Aegilops tauschii subsp. strangulata TaxID=200361 RepID=A0A453GDY2_AEGTS|nr:alpha/beta-gliadin clone PW1215-like [Aegilops tauschii subsp. strangulata]